jgi:hypothetical protein
MPDGMTKIATSALWPLRLQGGAYPLGTNGPGRNWAAERVEWHDRGGGGGRDTQGRASPFTSAADPGAPRDSTTRSISSFAAWRRTLRGDMKYENLMVQTVTADLQSKSATSSASFGVSRGGGFPNGH